MARYKVTLTAEEIEELEKLIQKGGKGYRIKHAQILLKLDDKPENKKWTYEQIKEAYHTSNEMYTIIKDTTPNPHYNKHC